MGNVYFEKSKSSRDSLTGNIVSQIERCLADFGIELKGQVLVGTSGGKDSTSLLLLLHEMKVEVIPVVVDPGHKNFDALAVSQYIEKLGFTVRVVSRNGWNGKHQTANTRNNGFRHIPHISTITKNSSPCGPCSRMKRMLLLNEARNSHSEWVAFGHHMHDFLATILKDFFIERYYLQHGLYSAELFSNFIQNESIDLRELLEMVYRQAAATMAVRLPITNAVSIVRPMAYVSEDEIRAFVKLKGIQTFGSGCSHDIFSDPTAEPTKREIVHTELHKRLRIEPELASEILGIARSSLDNTGRPLFNPRATREMRYPGFTNEGTVL